ncbi:unnamed protein product [Rotaria magnacalcarata]|uniref:Aldehyde dehydrogenase n=1 Tax=Rotaria magnacalcarata TaxID=392030 RepID=A0A815TQG5_9BILA|nr:unnamed protein product [Rotaria magnacalcarata]
MIETRLDDVENIFKGLRESFDSGKTKSLSWRKNQIEQLYKMCNEQKHVFASALNDDFHRPSFETLVFDCGSIRNECTHALNEIDEWVRDKKISDAFAFAMLDKYIHPEPLGVALIIGSWNYPYLVTLTPLVGAIAAGNCVILKPSELAPKSAAIMAAMVERYLDPSCVRVVLGGADHVQVLLKGDINKVFYTGSTTVGKIIMKAAAEKMIPVTLECGGKNPVYIADDANMEICAKRIAWGKAINCGQTCLAPDYILCSKTTENRIVPEIIKAWRQFYTDTPLNSESYCHIINNRHFERVKKLINQNKVVHGGETDSENNYIAPTIMTDVTENDDIMREEIFGPILPFITANNEAEAIKFMNNRDKPLALYVFSSTKSLAQRIINSTSAGSTCVNDVIFQIAAPSLPFGGVGASGLGSYHGKYSFDTFSHQRTVVYAPNWTEPILSKRNPPYNPTITGLMEKLTKVHRNWFPMPRFNCFGMMFTVLALAVGISMTMNKMKDDKSKF